MPERYVVHRKRGQLPPFALIFHLEMNSLLEPVEGNGKVGGSPESPTPPPPPQMQTHPFLSPHSLRSEVEGGGGGRPMQGFPICLPQ